MHCSRDNCHHYRQGTLALAYFDKHILYWTNSFTRFWLRHKVSSGSELFYFRPRNDQRAAYRIRQFPSECVQCRQSSPGSDIVVSSIQSRYNEGPTLLSNSNSTAARATGPSGGLAIRLASSTGRGFVVICLTRHTPAHTFQQIQAFITASTLSAHHQRFNLRFY